jgi:phospholipase C
MVMIVTYDEHGGFFDHVSPPALRTDPPPGASYPHFDTLGVRVPAAIASPFVRLGSVFHGVLDHTSILKVSGERFGGGSYSNVVDKRPVGSASAVLDALGSDRPAPQPDSLVNYLHRSTAFCGFTPGRGPETPNQMAFQHALDTIRTHPKRPPDKFKELLDRFPAVPPVTS